MSSEHGTPPTFRELAIQECRRAQEEFNNGLMYAVLSPPLEGDDWLEVAWDQAEQIVLGTAKVILNDETLNGSAKAGCVAQLLHDTSTSRAAFFDLNFPEANLQETYPPEANLAAMLQKLLVQDDETYIELLEYIHDEYSDGVGTHYARLLELQRESAVAAMATAVDLVFESQPGATRNRIAEAARQLLQRLRKSLYSA